MSGKNSSRAGRARLGAIGFTVISVLLALAAAFVLAQLMKGKGLNSEDMTQIVVAKEKLAPGVPITESVVELRAWPKASVPDGAFTSVEDLLESGRIVPFQNILAGEPVMSHRLSQSGEASGMAPLVDADMRAFPVKIDRWLAASKMIYPGAYVDVMATAKLKKGGYISSMVLQNVKVLSVDGAVDGVDYLKPKEDKKKKKKARKKRGKSVVTLMVLPQEAEQLALVTQIGTLDLVLRGLTDEKIVKTDGADVYGVFGIPFDDPDPIDGEAAKMGAKPSTAAARAGTADKARKLRRTKKRRYRPTYRKPRKSPKKTNDDESTFEIK